MKTVSIVPLPNIKTGQEFLMELPSGAQVLHLLGQTQKAPIAIPGKPVVMRVCLLLRYVGDQAAVPVSYRFVVVVDGQQQVSDAAQYIDSLEVPGKPALHLFEVAIPERD